MNTAFRTPARNPDPVTSQESAVAIRATLEGYHGRIVEAMRQHGPMTQKEITAATGIAETSCGPPLRPMERAGVLEEGGRDPGKACPYASRYARRTDCCWRGTLRRSTACRSLRTPSLRQGWHGTDEADLQDRD